jgi:uncharacterized membrane protein YedE/YeeE
MLSTSKIAAGGLAAATTAVLGSYFGVLGTVGAAAATSIVTAVSTEVYQRSLARTAKRLRGRGTDDAYEPGQRAPERGQWGPARHPRPPARRSVLPGAILGSLVIFALGIGLVSGVEYARGAPLSGGSGGTSVGEVLHDALPPVVGDLLGHPRQADDSSDEDRQGDRRQPGLLDGLLSGR